MIGRSIAGSTSRCCADQPSLLPQSDEETAKDTTAQPDSTPKKLQKKPKQDAKPKAAADSAKADSAVNVRIDFDGMSQRILSLGVPVRQYKSIVAAADSAVFYAESLANEPGVTLHRYDFKKREAAPWQKGVLAYSLSTNGKKLLFQTGDGWTVAGTEGPPAETKAKKLNTAVRMRLDPPAEWHQIFREAWRYERDFFYVKNLHGANWDSVYKMYEPWVASVGHRSDLTHLLDILGGELSVGHSFTGGGDTPEVPRVSVGLLGADLMPDNGRYRIAHIYTGENWNPDLRAPLSEPGVKVSEGDYILEVNGVELKAPTEPYSLFEGTAGRQTVLRVNSKPVMEGRGSSPWCRSRTKSPCAPARGWNGTVAWWIRSRAASWPTSGFPIPPTTASSTSTGTTSPSRTGWARWWMNGLTKGATSRTT
jgi:tricorn protease